MHAGLEERFTKEEDVVFFHLQTVFEGAPTNTPERGPKEAKKHGVKVPVAYDARVDGERTSLFMRRFGTGGTPWTTIIDRSGKVRVNEFTRRTTAELGATIQVLLDEPAPAVKEEDKPAGGKATGGDAAGNEAAGGETSGGEE